MTCAHHPDVRPGINWSNLPDSAIAAAFAVAGEFRLALWSEPESDFESVPGFAAALQLLAEGPASDSYFGSGFDSDFVRVAQRSGQIVPFLAPFPDFAADCQKHLH